MSKSRAKISVVLLIAILLGVATFGLVYSLDNNETVTIGGVSKKLTPMGVMLVPFITAFGASAAMIVVAFHLWWEKHLPVVMSIVSGITAAAILLIPIWISLAELFILSGLYNYFLE